MIKFAQTHFDGSWAGMSRSGWDFEKEGDLVKVPKVNLLDLKKRWLIYEGKKFQMWSQDWPRGPDVRNAIGGRSFCSSLDPQVWVLDKVCLTEDLRRQGCLLEFVGLGRHLVAKSEKAF